MGNLSEQIPGFDPGCVVRGGVIYLPSGLEAAVQRWGRTSKHAPRNYTGERYVWLPRAGRMVRVRVIQAIALATIPNPDNRPRAERLADGSIVWAGAPDRPKKFAKHRFAYRVDWQAETRAT